MTPKQIELARHALGLPNRRRQSYRNHFVAGPEHKDYADWLAMVAEGAAIKRQGDSLSGGDAVFYLTLPGALTALQRHETLDAEDFPGTPAIEVGR